MNTKLSIAAPVIRSWASTHLRTAAKVLTALLVTLAPVAAADIKPFPLPSPFPSPGPRPIVVGPKSARVLANLSPGHAGTEIVLSHAAVEITVGQPGDGTRRAVPVDVQAEFRLQSSSTEPRQWLVGFPVSLSAYSGFSLEDFEVRSGGELVKDFGPVRRAVAPGASPGRRRGKSSRGVRGSTEVPSAPADSALRDMEMVWVESFAPETERTIQVKYTLRIPPQTAEVVARRVEARDAASAGDAYYESPRDFIFSLPDGQYYFFDYFLTSGALWQGPIGYERVTLRLTSGWPAAALRSTQPARLTRPDDNVWVYELSDEEPEEDLYFALSSPEQ